MPVGGFLQQVQFLRPGWDDLFEIVVVCLLLYRVLLLIRETRAIQMLLGILALAGIYLLAVLLDLSLMRRLIEAMLQYGAIAALVVFQPEMRAALMRLGQNPLLMRLLGPTQKARVVERLVQGAAQLAQSRTGAILAVQRETGLREYARTGNKIEARLSPEMLRTIFSPQSPLHDGAAIIVGETIQAARAILPLTQNPVNDRSLGTRHRAAIGLSDETDAFVIVISEETGKISVARHGKLQTDVDADQLREILVAEIPQESAPLDSIPALGGP